MRRELAVTHDRLDQASARLKHVERRTGPAVATYGDACDGVRAATEAVRDHDLIGQLGRPQHHAVDLARRVATWRRWADGAPIDLNELATAVHTLDDPNLRGVSHGYPLLADTIMHWASDSGLEQQLVASRTPAMRHAGLGLEI